MRSTWCTEEQEYMVMKTASDKSARTMASQVGGMCGRRANDSKASRLGGRSDTRRHRQFDRFGLKTGESVTSCRVRKGLTGLASKPEETGLTGLGLKIGGGLGAVKIRAEGTWRLLRACFEVKRSQRGVVLVRCVYEN